MTDAELRTALANDFGVFVRKAFHHRHQEQLPDDKYLELVFAFASRIARKERRRGVINLPPRHLKTFIISICLPAWILGKNPRAKILVLSYSETLAESIAYDIRQLLKAKWYRETFSTRLSPDRSRATDFVTTNGGGVFATSIHAGITGWGGDYIFVDDPHEQKDANNIERLNQVAERFDNTVMNRLNNAKTGCVLVVQHRLHEDDLSGHVLKQTGWDHLRLEFIAKRKRKIRVAGEVWKRKNGELLRPGAFLRRDIERIRKTGNFQALYQQDPRGAGLPRITAKMFLEFRPSQRINVPVVISVDTGQDQGAGNSFTVMQAWVIYEQLYFLEEQYRGRPSFHELRKLVRCWIIQRYRPSAILIEKAGIGVALLDDIPRPNWLTVVPVIARDSKTDRLRRNIDLIKDLLVGVASAPWRDEFVQEFIDFPNGKFTDQVDATSQLLDFLREKPTLIIPPRRADGVVALSSQPNVARQNQNSCGSALIAIARARPSWK
jgi:phage terminase large subunit-like protein